MANLYVRNTISSFFGIDDMKLVEYAIIEQRRQADEQAYLSTKKKAPASMERHDSLFDDEEDGNAAEKLAATVSVKEEAVEVKEPTPRWETTSHSGAPPQLFAIRLW